MPSILSCSCGARLRVPEGSSGKLFRCPRCQGEVAAPAEQAMRFTPAAPGATAALCPICQSGVGPSERVKTCPCCQITHHEACWGEVGGCSTYGCPEAPAQTKEPVAETAPQTAWGDTKACPACGEKIKSIALRCRYCGTDFDTVDPLSVKDLRRGVRKAEEVSGTQTQVIILFILSLSGCLAPLALILTPILMWQRQKYLVKAGPAYQVLAYSTLGLSMLYSLLMVLFAVFS